MADEFSEGPDEFPEGPDGLAWDGGICDSQDDAIVLARGDGPGARVSVVAVWNPGYVCEVGAEDGETSLRAGDTGVRVLLQRFCDTPRKWRALRRDVARLCREIGLPLPRPRRSPHARRSRTSSRAAGR